jgi:hypothetical protein
LDTALYHYYNNAQLPLTNSALDSADAAASFDWEMLGDFFTSTAEISSGSFLLGDSSAGKTAGRVLVLSAI